VQDLTLDSRSASASVRKTRTGTEGSEMFARAARAVPIVGTRYARSQTSTTAVSTGMFLRYFLRIHHVWLDLRSGSRFHAQNGRDPW
jgi:hypothetical protein